MKECLMRTGTPLLALLLSVAAGMILGMNTQAYAQSSACANIGPCVCAVDSENNLSPLGGWKKCIKGKIGYTPIEVIDCGEPCVPPGPVTCCPENCVQCPTAAPPSSLTESCFEVCVKGCPGPPKYKEFEQCVTSCNKICGDVARMRAMHK